MLFVKFLSKLFFFFWQWVLVTILQTSLISFLSIKTHLVFREKVDLTAKKVDILGWTCLQILHKRIVQMWWSDLSAKKNIPVFWSILKLRFTKSHIYIFSNLWDICEVTKQWDSSAKSFMSTSKKIKMLWISKLCKVYGILVGLFNYSYQIVAKSLQ